MSRRNGILKFSPLAFFPASGFNLNTSGFRTPHAPFFCIYRNPAYPLRKIFILKTCVAQARPSNPRWINFRNADEQSLMFFMSSVQDLLLKVRPALHSKFRNERVHSSLRQLQLKFFWWLRGKLGLKACNEEDVTCAGGAIYLSHGIKFIPFYVWWTCL